MADSDCITLHGHITYHPMEILLQPRVTVIERERSFCCRSPEITAKVTSHGRFVDLAGRRVGTLTIVELWGRRRRDMNSDRGNSTTIWLCRCNCGEVRLVDKMMLLKGAREDGKNGVRRCIKCQRATRVATTTARQRRRFGTFHHEHPHEFKSWHGMKNRCKRDIRYISLGYCSGLDTFGKFMSIVGPAPSTNHTVDRIDSERGYHCGKCEECKAANRTCNVRWATQRTQSVNRSHVKLIDWKGERLVLRELCEREDVPYQLVHGRVTRGWSLEDALKIPAGSPRPDRYSGVASSTTPEEVKPIQLKLF